MTDIVSSDYRPIIGCLYLTDMVSVRTLSLPEQIPVVAKRRSLDEAQTTQNPEARDIHGALSTPSFLMHLTFLHVFTVHYSCLA